jgi:hypothetical protein
MRSRVGVGGRLLGRGRVGDAPSSGRRIRLSARGSLLRSLLRLGLCWPPPLLLVRRLACGMDGGGVGGADGGHEFSRVGMRRARLEQAADRGSRFLRVGALLSHVGARVEDGVGQLLAPVVRGRS